MDEDMFAGQEDVLASKAAADLVRRHHILGRHLLISGGNYQTAWEIAEKTRRFYRDAGNTAMAEHWQKVADCLPAETVDYPRRLTSLYAAFMTRGTDGRI